MLNKANADKLPFQFQSGSIKRKNLSTYIDFGEEFQFQSGSIKRLQLLKFNDGFFNFNSKVVRLKAKAA